MITRILKTLIRREKIKNERYYRPRPHSEVTCFQFVVSRHPSFLATIVDDGRRFCMVSSAAILIRRMAGAAVSSEGPIATILRKKLTQTFKVTVLRLLYFLQSKNNNHRMAVFFRQKESSILLGGWMNSCGSVSEVVCLCFIKAF